MLHKNKKILFTIGFILLALLVIEGGLHLIAWVWEPEDPRLSMSAFRDKEWVKELDRDTRDMNKRAGAVYVPFVEWRGTEFASEYMNVDSEGKRHTYNPNTGLSRERKKVFVFGGSTVFGAGARDAYTIPSQLSRLLAGSSSDYEVFNYGQGGYTFSQELVMLTQLLRRGVVPDFVIFYNGANDIVGAYDAGKAGAIITEPLIRQKLEARGFAMITLGVKTLIKEYCKICRVGINIGRAISLKNFRFYSIAGLELSPLQLKELRGGIIQNYNQNIDFLEKLSRAYGFRYLVFWQPSLYFEQRYVGDEEKLTLVDWRLKDQNLLRLFQEVNNSLDVEGEYFYNLSDVLSTRNTQIYLDGVHVSEEGNSIIAEKMFSIFKNVHE